MKSENVIKIFIIDDDIFLLEALRKEIANRFTNESILLYCYENEKQLKENLYQLPDIAIVDYQLSTSNNNTLNGIDLIEQIKEKSAETEIILFTAHQNTNLAIKAFEQGAHDYVVKNNYMFQRLNVALMQCIKLRELKLELNRQKSRGTLAFLFIGFLLSMVLVIQIFAPHLFKK